MNYLPNNLLLKNAWAFQQDLQTCLITDLTGAYNGVTNTGGYGNGSSDPNPAIAWCLSSVLNIQAPDETTRYCDNNPVYAVNVFPTFPTIGNTPFSVIPQDIGLLQTCNLPDGIWKVNFVENFGQLAGWTRSGSTITATQTAHGYTTGQVITVAISSDLTAIPLGNYTITVTNANVYTFTGVSGGGTSGTFVTSNNQYQAINNFYMLNTTALCQALDKIAISLDSSCCNTEKQYKYEWFKLQLDIVNWNFCNGLLQKAACILADLENDVIVIVKL